jgi:hypothetical protein
MKDLRELAKNQEEDLLFWSMQNVIEDLPIIYTEFGLDYEEVDTLLENLYDDLKDSDYLEIINDAISLVRIVRLDLIDNKIDLTVMKNVLEGLLTIIEISTKRCK